MLPVDGAYLYRLGKAIQPLKNIDGRTSRLDAWLCSISARTTLVELLDRSVYAHAIRFATEPAKELIECLQAFTAKYPENEVGSQPIGILDAGGLSAALSKFENVFEAEFRNGNMFLATAKAAYDLRSLIFAGESLFPQPSFSQFFPEAVRDVQEGAKCLAFELYTASGFHFHRANESVVLNYLAVISKGEARPKRNLARYIQDLEKYGADKTICSCLRDLKDMHRNPLMHPEQSIENMDDAIALLNAIHTSITGMTREIRKLTGPLTDSGEG